MMRESLSPRACSCCCCLEAEAAEAAAAVEEEEVEDLSSIFIGVVRFEVLAL